ncbi:hypothetical protein MHTCC0001_21160 [Flavobacteriaceae bacterium MHTCC 0001]
MVFTEGVKISSITKRVKNRFIGFNICFTKLVKYKDLLIKNSYKYTLISLTEQTQIQSAKNDD